MKRFSSIFLLILFAALSTPACAGDNENSGADVVADAISDARGDVEMEVDTVSDDGGVEGDATSNDTTPDGATAEDTTSNDGEDVYEDPFEGLSDDALEAALRETHYGHRDLRYDGARDFMFAYDRDNVGSDGEIECVYTGRRAFVNDRSNAQSQHDYNTEHTWPQSRGASGVAKSDIHHLFVTDSRANTRRNNYFFDNVVTVDWEEGGSKVGQNAAGETRFEPRDVHKGNAARAVFYFAVTYEFDLNADEEATLRAWHLEDPVDAAERARNDAVEIVQSTRNFFIDRPELVARVSDY